MVFVLKMLPWFYIQFLRLVSSKTVTGLAAHVSWLARAHVHRERGRKRPVAAVTPAVAEEASGSRYASCDAWRGFLQPVPLTVMARSRVVNKILNPKYRFWPLKYLLWKKRPAFFVKSGSEKANDVLYNSHLFSQVFSLSWESGAPYMWLDRTDVTLGMYQGFMAAKI